METTPETGWFRCEGGSVIEMDLPLPEAIAQRVEKRAIVRVANADGEPFEERDPATGTPDDGTAQDLTAMFSPPANSASKSVWVGWAVEHLGMTVDAADALTKQDLIDLSVTKTRKA